MWIYITGHHKICHSCKKINYGDGLMGIRKHRKYIYVYETNIFIHKLNSELKVKRNNICLYLELRM